ncbi:hypothetical protein [Macrococcus brunensis]|uniref:hypothetical protein n=1 Tax=Macrococcus brunensis TaxID=198483 RepID=UPI001EF049F7|nr:hypothetical protein [Macrococcus brunensis]ULG71990.1 hypothetical protein MGG12_00235 [Macrococcus brunensis]
MQKRYTMLTKNKLTPKQQIASLISSSVFCIPFIIININTLIYDGRTWFSLFALISFLVFTILLVLNAYSIYKLLKSADCKIKLDN